MFRHVYLLLLLLLAACSSQEIRHTPPEGCRCPVETEPHIPIPEPVKPEPKPEVKIPDYGLLKPAQWQDMQGLEQDNLTLAWPAWLQSCAALKNKPLWQPVCATAVSMGTPDAAAIQQYFMQNFDIYATTNADGKDTGLITGYYEPLLKGSRKKTDVHRYPLYARPDDLIIVDLASLFPELANKRVRGRVEGNRLIPYYTRGEIDTEPSPLNGKELLWVNDPIDAFFLQIQGSGLVVLENGEQVHVGYADQNGQSYQSIGRILINRGELTADKASMQGIKNWARSNPDKLPELLNSNPSYVFFRELPHGLPGPLGALGVPILAERVVAVDPRFVPLGAPVFLATTYPNSSKPLNRLMMAQDTGGAIKGGVRADFFWGAGTEAGKQAGAMKQQGKIWVLLPKGFVLPDMQGFTANK